MRICIPVPCFFGKMDFCEAIAKIAQLGFDAAETYNWKSRCATPASNRAWNS